MDSEKGASKTRLTEKKSLSLKISDFIRSNRSLLFVVLIAVLLFVIGVALWSILSNLRSQAATAQVELIENSLSSYETESDLTKKSDLEKGILAAIDKLAKDYPKSYSARRAFAIKARIAEEKKDWAAAELAWVSAADSSSEDFLVPIALQGAAIAAEERGANDKAIGYYKRLVDKYASKTVGIPHAYFALGRMAEETKDYPSALAYYEKILSGYPDEDWTKLAKDRIIFMKSKGLVK